MQIVELNLVPKGVSPVIYLSQFDIKRPFQVRIYDDVDAYRIPSGAVVKIEGVKQDAKIFQYASNLDPGVITYTGDLVTVYSTEQMTAIHGAVYAEIVIESGGSVIATLNFTIQIERSALGGYTDASHSEITGLSAITDQVKKLRDETKGYRDNANASQTNASKYADAAKKSADSAASSEEKSKASETNAGKSASAASSSETNAKKSEDHVEEMLSNTETARVNLQNTIDTAENTNATLLNANSTATKMNQTLNESTTAANETNTTLVKNTNSANTANDSIVKSTKEANDLNVTLSNTINAGNTAKVNLDNSISKADSIKVALDNSNATASATKEDLDGENSKAADNIANLKEQNEKGEDILKSSKGVMSISVNGEIQQPSETKNVDLKIPTKSQETYTLAAKNWIGASAPFSYPLPDKYSSMSIVIGFDSVNATRAEYDTAIAAEITGGSDNKVYAWGVKPTGDIPVVIQSFD